ncbi:unnamed protein product [Schistocephalus solidus]|uniref:Uncharacterized protein n=1 Tax=Schistocephalus solidus TaxID=70667 RepID=A0A183SNJ4_SCHSO|nr:unnamed protein product [Schistocephalus solidus]
MRVLSVRLRRGQTITAGITDVIVTTVVAAKVAEVVPASTGINGNEGESDAAPSSPLAPPVLPIGELASTTTATAAATNTDASPDSVCSLCEAYSPTYATSVTAPTCCCALASPTETPKLQQQQTPAAPGVLHTVIKVEESEAAKESRSHSPSVPVVPKPEPHSSSSTTATTTPATATEDAQGSESSQLEIGDNRSALKSDAFHRMRTEPKAAETPQSTSTTRTGDFVMPVPRELDDQISSTSTTTAPRDSDWLTPEPVSAEEMAQLSVILRSQDVPPTACQTIVHRSTFGDLERIWDRSITLPPFTVPLTSSGGLGPVFTSISSPRVNSGSCARTDIILSHRRVRHGSTSPLAPKNLAPSDASFVRTVISAPTQPPPLSSWPTIQFDDTKAIPSNYLNSDCPMELTSKALAFKKTDFSSVSAVSIISSSVAASSQLPNLPSHGHPPNLTSLQQHPDYARYHQQLLEYVSRARELPPATAAAAAAAAAAEALKMKASEFGGGGGGLLTLEQQQMALLAAAAAASASSSAVAAACPVSLHNPVSSVQSAAVLSTSVGHLPPAFMRDPPSPPATATPAPTPQRLTAAGGTFYPPPGVPPVGPVASKSGRGGSGGHHHHHHHQQQQQQQQQQQYRQSTSQQQQQQQNPVLGGRSAHQRTPSGNSVSGGSIANSTSSTISGPHLSAPLGVCSGPTANLVLVLLCSLNWLCSISWRVLTCELTGLWVATEPWGTSSSILIAGDITYEKAPQLGECYRMARSRYLPAEVERIPGLTALIPASLLALFSAHQSNSRSISDSNNTSNALSVGQLQNFLHQQLGIFAQFPSAVDFRKAGSREAGALRQFMLEQLSLSSLARPAGPFKPLEETAVPCTSVNSGTASISSAAAAVAAHRQRGPSNAAASSESLPLNLGMTTDHHPHHHHHQQQQHLQPHRQLHNQQQQQQQQQQHFPRSGNLVDRHSLSPKQMKGGLPPHSVEPSSSSSHQSQHVAHQPTSRYSHLPPPSSSPTAYLPSPQQQQHLPPVSGGRGSNFSQSTDNSAVLGGAASGLQNAAVSAALHERMFAAAKAAFANANLSGDCASDSSKALTVATLAAAAVAEVVAQENQIHQQQQQQQLQRYFRSAGPPFCPLPSVSASQPPSLGSMSMSNGAGAGGNNSTGAAAAAAMFAHLQQHFQQQQQQQQKRQYPGAVPCSSSALLHGGGYPGGGQPHHQSSPISPQPQPPQSNKRASQTRMEHPPPPSSQQQQHHHHLSSQHLQHPPRLAHSGGAHSSNASAGGSGGPYRQSTPHTQTLDLLAAAAAAATNPALMTAAGVGAYPGSSLAAAVPSPSSSTAAAAAAAAAAAISAAQLTNLHPQQLSALGPEQPMSVRVSSGLAFE